MYISTVISSMFSIIFVIFLIAALGYLLGAVSIKGVSLGTAGVLVVALIYGIIVSYLPSFSISGKEIVLFDAAIKTRYSLVSSMGTSLFVTSVGLIAGPKFFRSFNKSSLSYIYMGVAIILSGALVTVLFILANKEMSASMAVGLMTGALTSTPGLSAAKEISQEADLVTAGYGIAYIFGVLGVVLFVQIVPKVLHVDMEEERARFISAGEIRARELKGETKKLEPYGFLPFFLTIAFGCMIGSISIPGINFSLGNSGGCLLAGLIIGHYGHLGKIDLDVDKKTLNFFRELGLVLFLIGAGVPAGVNFISSIKLVYFFYGIVMTLVPMFVGYILARKVFKIDLLNSLGSITGGMTSTPALGALISTAGTDEVTAAYAATYPIALVVVVLAAKIIVLVL